MSDCDVSYGNLGMCLRSGKAFLNPVTEVLYMPKQVINVLACVRFQCEHFVAGCVKILFCPMLLCIQEGIAMFEGFQSSSLPTCPFDKSILR